MTAKKALSEKEQVIKGWEARIKHHRQQLAKTKSFNRASEAALEKKIRMEVIQLKGIKKV